MARPQKEGLDYFPLDVDIDQDEKIALIEAQHGPIGFAIIVKILMRIYRNGYFYEWGEKEQLLFSKVVNVDINLVIDVVNDCLKWGLFSKKMYEEHGILTSRGIQRRYLEATARRNKTKITDVYCLLSDDELNGYKNVVIVDINDKPIEVYANNNPQSKVKESKVKESKVKKSKESSQSKHAASDFFIENFGMASPFVIESIEQWVDDFDQNQDIVIAAMQIALKNNVRNFKYCESILKEWHSNNLRTLEAIRAYETNKRDNKIKRLRVGNQRTEIIPKWMKEGENFVEEPPPDEFEKRVKALESMLSNL
jgi:DnaD/phage-associated family protein